MQIYFIASDAGNVEVYIIHFGIGSHFRNFVLECPNVAKMNRSGQVTVTLMSILLPGLKLLLLYVQFKTWDNVSSNQVVWWHIAKLSDTDWRTAL